MAPGRQQLAAGSEGTEVMEEWVSRSDFTMKYTITITIGVILSALFFIAIYLPTYMKRRRQTKESMDIIFYVQNFVAGDIDLQRAPTDGYHGTYSYKLAQAINGFQSPASKKTNNTDILAKSTHDNDDSSISLYEDTKVWSKEGPTGIYRASDSIQQRSLTRACNKKDSLFLDATESMPYSLGYDDQDEEYATDFGLISENAENESYPWKDDMEDII